MNFITLKCIYNSENYIDYIFAINIFYFYFGLYRKSNTGYLSAEECMFIKPIKFIVNNFILFNILCHYKLIYKYIKS